MKKEPERTLPQSAGLQDQLKKSPDYALRYTQLVQDVKNLSPGELHAAHPHEYSSWSNRKHWAKENTVQWSASMATFPDFLMVNGPIPQKAWTLDRINPTGHYIPENVRWASKQMQSQNRTSARLVTFNGATRTLGEVAQLVGIPYDTLRIGIDRRGSAYLAKVSERFAAAASNSEETLWQFPEEYREMMELHYSVREDENQNRIRFFLEFMRSEYGRLDFAASIAPDPASKSVLAEEGAVVRALHNEAARFLQNLATKRRSAASTAHYEMVFGSSPAPEPDSDDPSVQASRFERPD